MRCQACNFNCQCPRRDPTGEGKIWLGLTAEELKYLLGQGTPTDIGPLLRRLERALDMLEGTP